jgi:two-component system C4-dicarboxylate transport response regulator DctD
MTNILVIDDNQDILDFLKSSLETLYEVKTCASVREASKLLKSFHPDLMILDIVMSEIDGQVFAELVRELHPEIKVLMITGHHYLSPDSKDTPFPVIYKPFLKNTLLHEVERLLL